MERAPVRWLVMMMLVSLLLAPGCSSSRPIPETDQPAPPAAPEACETADAAIIQWLAAEAHPLVSLEAGAPFADLKPLRKALQGVRVVALGEATHGTREFFTMKHRLVEFLVREMGFTVFAIEGSYSEALLMDDYVTKGQGTARSGLRSINYWTWYTEEVESLVEWMRVHNRDLPAERQVRALGFDVQTAMRGAHLLEAYLEQVDPAYAREVKTLLMTVRNLRPPFAQEDAHVLAQNLAQLQGLVERLSEHATAYIKESSPREHQQALSLARNAYRTYHVNRSLPEAVYATRDHYMAQTVLEILEEHGPEAKVILWAHDLHIWTQEPSMGFHLRNRLGDQYYPLGFAFFDGSVRAITTDANVQPTSGPVVHQMPPATRGTADWYFACANLGNSLIDLRHASWDSKVRAWLHEPQRKRMFGAAYSAELDERFVTPVLLTRFDGLIFIPRTTATRPLPW